MRDTLHKHSEGQVELTADRTVQQKVAERADVEKRYQRLMSKYSRKFVIISLKSVTSKL